MLSAGHAARRGRARRRGRRRRRRGARSPGARGSRCSAPAMSCARPASRSGPGEIHNSNAPDAGRAGARAAAPTRRRPRGCPTIAAATEAGARGGARARRRRGRLRRRLGRPPRPRQAGAGGARRRGGVLGRRAAARQADLVRSRATARSCSGCPATRSRRSSPSRCSSPRRWPRSRAPRRAAARRRAPSSARRCAATPAASRRSGCGSSSGDGATGRDPQRPAGLAHHHLADRRRRAGDDPGRRRASSRPGTAVALEPLAALTGTRTGQSQSATGDSLARPRRARRAGVGWSRRAAPPRRLPARAVIVSPRQSTVVARDGAVRSVQSAELTLAPAELERLWARPTSRTSPAPTGASCPGSRSG